jgi:hypothetical protein
MMMLPAPNRSGWSTLIDAASSGAGGCSCGPWHADRGSWETRKVARKKTVKVLVITFSGPLEPGPAQNLGNYALAALEKTKANGKAKTKSVPLASATYGLAPDCVTLTPRGTVPNQPLQLTIVAARILDDEGEPVAANSGRDFVATLGSKGVSPT